MKILCCAFFLLVVSTSSLYWRDIIVNEPFSAFIVWFVIPVVGVFVVYQFTKGLRMNIMFIHADVEQLFKRRALLLVAFLLIIIPLFWPSYTAVG